MGCLRRHASCYSFGCHAVPFSDPIFRLFHPAKPDVEQLPTAERHGGNDGQACRG